MKNRDSIIAYPIKFRPILKEKIWGGNRLSTLLNKESTSQNIGESWEISNVENNISVVSNGVYRGKSFDTLIRKYDNDILGQKVYDQFGHNFPLLIKYLDAKTDLSVQVHPDDEMAKKYHNSFGKTEMWYIMDTEENSEIVLGMKDKEPDLSVLNTICKENVDQVFNRVKVKNGDSYFIPAGQIHAIGSGVLAAEIQQTSDITYRVYDWDRMDANGNKRELHTDLAKDATKTYYKNSKCEYQLIDNSPSNLADTKYFTTNILRVTQKCERTYDNVDSFKIFMCIEGSAKITVDGNYEFIEKGETVLIPAKIKNINIDAIESKLLEIYIS